MSPGCYPQVCHSNICTTLNPLTRNSQGIHARHCFTNDSLSLTNEHRLNLTHPDQLLAFDGCTSLAGNIYLQDNFTGAIVLNDVTNFTGILGSNSYDYNLDSVEMLNVKYIQELDLHSAPRMNRVAMPRLERIEHLSLQQYPEGSWFDFAALKFAGRVYIYGSYEKCVVTFVLVYRDRSKAKLTYTV